MSVFYLANPENPQAVELVDYAGRGPDEPKSLSVYDYVVLILGPLNTLIVCLHLIGGSYLTACIYVLVAAIWWNLSIPKWKKVRARSEYRPFLKLVDEGEIIEVPKEVRDEFTRQSRKLQSPYQLTDYVLLQESFQGVSTLLDTLREIDEQGPYTDPEDIQIRARAIRDAVREMITHSVTAREGEQAVRSTWLRKRLGYEGELGDG